MRLNKILVGISIFKYLRTNYLKNYTDQKKLWHQLKKSKVLNQRRLL
jgi:hypothetical protein